MPCPNCNSNDTWDDNLHWGCNQCHWSSLAGLNTTRTPSNPNNPYEVEARRRSWQQKDATELKRLVEE